MKFRTLFACVVLQVLLIAPPAGAHSVFVEDWNDSSSVLDIQWSGFGHDGKVLFGAIGMVRAVRSSELAFEGDLYVDFDSRGNYKPDFYLWIDRSGGRLKGSLWKYTTSSSQWVAPVSVWRYDDKTFNFAFNKGRLNMSGGYVRWFVTSRYFKGREYDKILYYWDYAPNRGMKTHRF